MLITLKEVHAIILQDNESMSVSFSKFADLRPVHIFLESEINITNEEANFKMSMGSMDIP